MKAAIYESYGPPEVLRIEEVPIPTLDDEHADRVLVRVHYASINPLDYLHRMGFLPVRVVAGLMRPKPKDQILGADVAGEVVAVGKNVTRFKVGDQVFGNCWGSHAEYVRVRQSTLALMPSTLSLKEAAVIPVAGLTALQALRDVAQIQKGQKVLINGASGGVGHFAVQLAKHLGAEVTAVCSTSNIGWVKALGADELVDYTQEDFTKNGKQYDLILDAVGKRTYYSCKPALTPTGLYVTENFFKSRHQILQMLLSAVIRDKRVKTHLARPNQQDMDLLRELAQTGKLKPMIEKTYTLDQIAQAHQHGQGGHTKGKVAIEVKG